MTIAQFAWFLPVVIPLYLGLFMQNGVHQRIQRLAAVSEEAMSKHRHLPPIPAANHSQKGTGDHSETPAAERPKKARINPAEEGQTANIKQNTTNKGFFKGRRVK